MSTDGAIVPGDGSDGAMLEGDRTTSDYPESVVLRALRARVDEPLHDFLDRSRSAIVERFVRMLREESPPRTTNAPRTVIIDDLPFFLADLADGLRGALTTRTERARHHSNRRHRHGFDLGAVLREYSVLRRSIHAAVHDAGAAPTPDEIAALDHAIDDAMIEAALSYANDRDAELRSESDALAEERERLRRAVAAREEVLAIVSHDLRSPLASIALCVEQLRRSRGEDPARRTRALDAITRATQRMSTLIEDLLALSKHDAGQLSLVRAPCTAASMIDDAVEMARPLAEAKSITLRTSAVAELVIECDRDRMLQVLSNLIGNAIKFTPEHGEVTVDATAADDRARFVVRDTGPGIDPAALPHVFERFYQGPGSRPGGAGLGLAIARAMVEAHGGDISVESTLGAGTTFTFTVPLAAAS